MADQITDNRTLVTNADAVGAFDDLTGGAAGTLDNEIFIQGTGSIGEYLSNSLAGLLFDAGSAQNWANNTFYVWINCGIVGLLDTKANGGFRIRFCGNTVTDWFEVFVAGSDDWPPAVEGGWVQFVVDIETARSEAITNGWTNGTVPATSAIRYVGWAGITAGAMPRMLDNTWMDEIRRLPDGTPGILVEGRNGGTTPWNSADIASQLGTAVGTFVESTGGSYKINTPIQFGINDTTTHDFEDTNAIWLWDNQEFLPDDFYQISALGNAGGSTTVTMGVKTGTGADATGAQGLSIAAASNGARWDMDFSDPNLDAIELYGCSFTHGRNFDLDSSAVDLVTVGFVDCVSALVTGASIVRANVVQPANGDGVAFMSTTDLGDISNSTFEFLDGHAIEVLSGGPASQSNVGNIFLGAFGGTSGDNNTPNSGSTDAMIYNNAGAARTFNRSGGGTQPSFRNGLSATSDDVASISLTFTPLELGSDVIVQSNPGGSNLASTDNSGATFVASVDAGASIDYRIYKAGFLDIEVLGVSFAQSQNVNVNQQIDRNFIEDA